VKDATWEEVLDGKEEKYKNGREVGEVLEKTTFDFGSFSLEKQR